MRAVLLAAALVAGACSGGAGEPELWSATGTLVAAEGEPVMLCALVDGTMECGAGVPVEGVVLSEVPGLERHGRVRYVQGVRLTGTWDGTVLHVAAPPEAVGDRHSPPHPYLREPPCPEPAGGWPGGIPSTEGPTIDEALEEAVRRYADEHPDTLGGWWVNGREGVVTMAFVGDLAPHRRALAGHGAAICLLEVEYTHRQLRRASTVANGALTRAGLLTLSNGTNVVRNRADVQLLVHDPRAEQILRDRGLDRIVDLGVWLAPVD